MEHKTLVNFIHLQCVNILLTKWKEFHARSCLLSLYCNLMVFLCIIYQFVFNVYLMCSATPVWLPMHRDALLPGQFCAGHVDGAWRRIRIVHEDEHAHETVLVSLLDWGGHRTMTCDALRWLPLKFAKLPQQALHARLTDDAESVQLVAGQQFTFRLVNCDFKVSPLQYSLLLFWNFYRLSS